MDEGKGLRKIEKKLEVPAIFELVDMENLEEEERLAVQEAIAVHKKSTNEEYHAGATAVAEDGTRVARHNEIQGTTGHAEQLALTALYRAVSLNPSQRKLKLLALAGSRPGEEVIREKEKYPKDVSLKEVECGKVCGRCLKFISDYSANSEDVKILLVAATGQVVRTSLRSLYPMPHIPTRVSLKPLEQNIEKPPDTYTTGGK